MGTTIHYHGCIEDRDRIEEFEVRVLDLAWEIGASAQVWRSAAEEDPTRARRFTTIRASHVATFACAATAPLNNATR